MDKSNTTSACPLCGEIKYWDHILLCEQNKNKRDELVKGLETKLKKMKQHEYVDDEERDIVKEMLNNVNKHFDNNNNYCTNQKFIGHRDLFRGVIVKE